MSFKNSLSTGHHCVVYGCSYNQKKRNAARKELCGTHNVLQEVCGCNVYLLHRFPADADLKRQWVAAVNRKDFVPSPSSRVCSAHFVDGKRTDLNFTAGSHSRPLSHVVQPSLHHVRMVIAAAA